MSSNVENSVYELSVADDFWLRVSKQSLNKIWNDIEDDIYTDLLEVSVIVSGENDEHLRRDN